MMKSEWDPLKTSKPADIKQRLNNLFGRFEQYSDFTLVSTSSPTINESSHAGKQSSSVSGSGIKHEYIEENDGNTRNDLDKLIGQLVNVKKPLSPVPSIRLSPEKMTSIAEDTGQTIKSEPNIAKSSRILSQDLESIIQQLTCVAPLISPIRSTEHQIQISENKCRKRPNFGSSPYESPVKRATNCTDEWEKEESSIRNKAEYSKNDARRNAELSTEYKIKLSKQSFSCLLQQKNIHLEKANGNAEEAIKVNKSCSDESLNNALSDAITSTEANPLEQTMPNCPATFEKGKSLTTDDLQKRVRELKKSGSNERDGAKQILFYFESIAFYIMASATLASKPEKSYSSVSEAANFLNSSWSSFKNSKTVTSSPSASYIRQRLKGIQMMINSCLAYHLYSIRSSQALSIYTILQRYDKENPQNLKRPVSRGPMEGMNSNGNSLGTATSSPAASTPSSSRSVNSQQPATVTLPADIYSNMSQQIRTLHHLMWSHKLWKDAKAYTADNKTFVDGLNTLCGELRHDSELADVAVYLLTAIYWLRKHYELMDKEKRKKNDQ